MSAEVSLCPRIGVWTCWLRPAFVQHGLLPICRHRLSLYCNKRLVHAATLHYTLPAHCGSSRRYQLIHCACCASIFICSAARPETWN